MSQILPYPEIPRANACHNSMLRVSLRLRAHSACHFVSRLLERGVGHILDCLHLEVATLFLAPMTVILARRLRRLPTL
jgi:hypothetical protein